MSYAGRRFYLPLPPATKTLFLINVAVFVANMFVLGRLSAPTQGGGGFWFAFSWPAMLEGYGLGAVRLITYQFTHSFDEIGHILFNMLALWFFGPRAESRIGQQGMYRLYLWGGAVGAFGHLIAAALTDSLARPLVGASGSCYALLVFAACTAPRDLIVFVFVTMELWVLASLLCFIGIYETFLELVGRSGGSVAHSAHLGGALLGWLAFRFGWFVDHADFGGRERPGFLAGLLARLRSARARRHQQAAEHLDLQLDTILAKVKEHGLGSLTPAERRFLERVSQQKGR